MYYQDGGYDGGSMLEVFFWFLLMAVVLGGIIGLSRKKPDAAPQIPMWPALPSFPSLTAQEAAAIAQANVTGIPFDFIQPHPQTGQVALFRATPHGHGHGSITLAPTPVGTPYLGYSGGGTPFKSF